MGPIVVHFHMVSLVVNGSDSQQDTACMLVRRLPSRGSESSIAAKRASKVGMVRRKRPQRVQLEPELVCNASETSCQDMSNAIGVGNAPRFGNGMVSPR